MSKSTSDHSSKRTTRNDGLMHHDKKGSILGRNTSPKSGARHPSGRPPRPPKK